MSDIRFIKKPLNDIFIVGRGLPKYTQSYANRNKGEYPVYSSKTEMMGCSPQSIHMIMMVSI